jgi:hypothetical protein
MRCWKPNLPCRAHQPADDLYSTLLEINADENIPIQRTNGQRSKENHGNQAQDEAMKRIRNMIQATGWVSGKW